MLFDHFNLILNYYLYDRHYETFDGTEFNMRADQDCSYILARSSGTQDISFQIVIENHNC